MLCPALSLQRKAIYSSSRVITCLGKHWSLRGSVGLAGGCQTPAKPLGCLPAGLLPTGRTSRSGSFGESGSGSEGRRRSGAARVQAIVPHATGVNRTLLRFDPGDVITVLMPDAQNGWLYGKLEGSSTYVILGAVNWPDACLSGLELGGLSLKLCPPSPPGVAWALHLTHHPRGTSPCPRSWSVRSTGALQAEEMRWGRANADELPERAPGALGGKARDAVTLSRLA